MELLHFFNWERVGILFSDNGKDRKCHYVNEGFQAIIHTGRSSIDPLEVKAEGTRITDQEIDNYLDNVLKKVRSKTFIVSPLTEFKAASKNW